MVGMRSGHVLYRSSSQKVDRTANLEIQHRYMIYKCPRRKRCQKGIIYFKQQRGKQKALQTKGMTGRDNIAETLENIRRGKITGLDPVHRETTSARRSRRSPTLS